MKMDVDTWSEILLTITRNKIRSLLTAFGVFWGIFMLIILIGGGKGLQQMLSQNFAGFATNSGFIWSQPTSKAYKGFQKDRQWDMDIPDISMVRTKIKGLQLVTPFNINQGGVTTYQDKKGQFSIKGLYPEYAQIEEPEMIYGRFINDIDVSDRRTVCTIGKRVQETLFGKNIDPCGKYIQIGGIYFRVIGVSGVNGNINIGGRSSECIIIPNTTFRDLYNIGTRVDLMCVLAKPGYKMPDLQKQIATIVKEKHLIAPDDDQALQLMNAEAMFSMMDNLFTGVRVLVWLVGLGTLLAGIIGVSNIMLVTVRERTTEIGIRRAIGAKPKDIMQQILSESIVLTLLAGMAGISFAVLILQVLEVGVNSGGTFSDIHFQVSFSVALCIALLLGSLGTVAGIAPAYRALSIKPIDAIRDE